MKILLVFSLFIAVTLANKVGNPAPGGPKKHMVCYYDSSSFVKEGE